MATSLVEEYHRQQQEQNEGLRRRMAIQVAETQDHDPERSNRVWAVSAATGLPNEVVDADLDNLESQLKAKSYDFEAYTDEETGSPIFNELATEDPFNYAVLNRDRMHMNAVERTIHSMYLGGRAGVGTIELANIANREIAGESLPGDEAQAKRLQSLLEGGEHGANNKFTKALVYTSQQIPIQGWLVGKSLDETAGMALAYGAGTLLAGQMGPQAAVPEEALTVPFMMGMGARHGFLIGRTKAAFELERGLAYSEFRELGFDPDDALLFANGVGGVNAALESVGLGALTKRIPGFRNFQRDKVGDALAHMFSKPTMRHAVTRMTLQYGEGLATEVLTEIAQESTLMLAREHMKRVATDAGDTRPEMTPMAPGEFAESLHDIMVQTLYGTVFLGAAGPLMNYRADAKRARAAEEQAAQWATLGEHAAASTTRSEAPTAWDTFVERIKEKGPLKEMRFDIGGWREYWQSQQVDPNEVAKRMGFDIENMDVTETDIVIPFDTYLKELAHTEHHMGLINDFRARPDEMTLREAEAWYKDEDRKVKEFEASLTEATDKSAYDEIVEDLTGQLIAGPKYTPQAADKQARMFAAMIVTAADSEGRDAVQLYKERFGGVYGQVPESLSTEGRDVDMDFDPIIDRIRDQDYPKQREIYGESLFDLIRSVGGIQDQGGELSARDVVKAVPGLVSKTGRTIDAIAEMAYEQGFIAEYDSDLLMEAFDRELGGDTVHGTNATVNYELEELLGQLEAAANFLETEQIDLQEMTNAEVREYLKGVKTLEQSSDSDLKQWTDLVFTVAMRQEVMSDQSKAYRLTGDTERDSLLARAEAMMPLVAEKQDFQDIQLTDKFVDSSGKIGTHTYSAQQAYDRAIKRRNVMNRLMDCING